jgi:hypothetical protein
MDRASKAHHIQRAGKLVVQRRGWAYWDRVGWDKLWNQAGAVHHRKSVARRTAIFRAVAPHAYKILGNAGVERFINECRWPSWGQLPPLALYERKIRQRYPR